MTNSRRRTTKENGSLRNRVAQFVFNDFSARGISDRALAERVTDEIIRRLDPNQPLFSLSQLQSLEEEVLSGKAVSALPKERKRPVPKSSPKSVTKERVPAPSPSPELQLTPNAITVLKRRYLKKDSGGQVIETPKQMFRRVAKNIASVDDLIYDSKADVKATEEEFYQLMASLEFLPNSPTLMNAGRELQQLSACFVLPVEDSMESIFDAVKWAALIQKSGGGTGFSFSRLRPKGDLVRSTTGVASGPVSFMRVFDTTTDVTKQGGTRRGANMAILNVDHPDIEEFITAKDDPNAFTNFNLSVALTEGFMTAVESGADYDLINPRRPDEVAGRLNAREVFEKIVDRAWRSGEPGIVFLDRINDHNPVPKLGAIESTNPCGEQPLLPFESCNLGSINLSRMIGDRDGKPDVDYSKLAKTVETAVHFLDNVIDANKFPLPQIEEMTKKTRKIGLGVMGFADMLIKLEIPYDSDEALEKAEDIMRFIQRRATEASEELAKRRKVFPAFKGSIYDRPGQPKVRNATRTTIAPTGTISIIAGCSSGIEPLFALSYVRNVMDEDKLIEVNPYFEEVAKREGFYSNELLQELTAKGNLRDIEGVPERVKRLFVTAHDITPEWHVRMQAAFQKETHNAISKTVNFPHDATRDDVARVFMLAYKEGCKGVTIYRDRSREGQVLATQGEERDEGIVPRRRPRATVGKTERVATGCGNLYVTVNRDDQGICEVFSRLGKAGGCASAQSEATSRLISLALRSGVDPESIVDQLRGIRCPSISWDQGESILSCPDAIGRVLERQLQLEEKGTDSNPTDNNSREAIAAPNLAGQCPECSNILIYQEGCFICRFCGYTKCE